MSTSPHYISQALEQLYPGHTYTIVGVLAGTPFLRDINDNDTPIPQNVLDLATQLENTPPTKTWERVLDFKLEFTETERQAMRSFAKVDAVADDFLDLLNSATRIVADDPLLIQGLNYMIANGKLTQARVDQILGAQ